MRVAHSDKPVSLYSLDVMISVRYRVKSKKGIILTFHDKSDLFKSAIESIYQTFDAVELYPGLEEKVVTHLYLITKLQQPYSCIS